MGLISRVSSRTYRNPLTHVMAHDRKSPKNHHEGDIHHLTHTRQDQDLLLLIDLVPVVVIATVLQIVLPIDTNRHRSDIKKQNMKTWNSIRFLNTLRKKVMLLLLHLK